MNSFSSIFKIIIVIVCVVSDGYFSICMHKLAWKLKCLLASFNNLIVDIIKVFIIKTENVNINVFLVPR